MGSSNTKSGKLGFSNAIRYLNDLSINPIGAVFSSSLGRTMDAQIFKNWYNSGNFNGIMAWFCSKNKNGVPFLVFEKMPTKFDYMRLSDSRAMSLIPNSDDLVYSTHGFSRGMNGQGYNFDWYLRRQRNYVDPITFSGDRQVVSKWIQNFREIESLNSYYSVPHGYLENDNGGKNYFEIFLFNQSREVKYIRYFFGFDPLLKNDKIRFFLVPVDADGFNIINDSQSVDGVESANFLQYSWPPKPTGTDE